METAAAAEAEGTQSEGGGAGEDGVMVKTLEELEKEAISIAQSFTSLFSSLRSDLSEVSHFLTLSHGGLGGWVGRGKGWIHNQLHEEAEQRSIFFDPLGRLYRFRSQKFPI